MIPTQSWLKVVMALVQGSLGTVPGLLPECFMVVYGWTPGGTREAVALGSFRFIEDGEATICRSNQVNGPIQSCWKVFVFPSGRCMPWHPLRCMRQYLLASYIFAQLLLSGPVCRLRECPGLCCLHWQFWWETVGDQRVQTQWCPR